jgi:hypothetical protein
MATTQLPQCSEMWKHQRLVDVTANEEMETFQRHLSTLREADRRIDKLVKLSHVWRHNQQRGHGLDLVCVHVGAL